jgi:hypothetical protein
MSKDAWTFDLLYLVRAVGDDPVSGDQLDRLGAFVGDAYREGEVPPLPVGFGV